MRKMRKWIGALGLLAVVVGAAAFIGPATEPVLPPDQVMTPVHGANMVAATISPMEPVLPPDQV